MAKRNFLKEFSKALRTLVEECSSGSRGAVSRPKLETLQAARMLLDDADNTKAEPERPPVRIYEKLASLSIACANCLKSNNIEWLGKHHDAIDALMKRTAPSGSGIDSGTRFKSGSEKELIFYADFHHMDESGGYCGWSYHQIKVWPSLQDRFTISISGTNKNDIKEYLHQVFYEWLNSSVPEGF